MSRCLLKGCPGYGWRFLGKKRDAPTGSNFLLELWPSNSLPVRGPFLSFQNLTGQQKPTPQKNNTLAGVCWQKRLSSSKQPTPTLMFPGVHYAPVDLHSHAKSTILMVFTRKHGDFHGRTVSLPEGNGQKKPGHWPSWRGTAFSDCTGSNLPVRP